LASNFGGPIATRVDQNKKNVPESAQYRVIFYTSESWLKSELALEILRGTLKIETQHRSLIQQSLIVTFLESGF